MDNPDTGPIILMWLSLIILIISVFILYYYPTPSPAATAAFSIGIAFGLIACIWFIHNRTPVAIPI